MNRQMKSVVFLGALSGLVAGCATQEAPSGKSPERLESPRGNQQQQLNFQLASGTYGCELGQKVEIQRDERNGGLIELKWQSNRYTLRRYDSSSGLPRYEDRENGLLWIDLPWKSVLMDAKSGRPLANECKAARS